jgi:hypothetical protein
MQRFKVVDKHHYYNDKAEKHELGERRGVVNASVLFLGALCRKC